MGAKGCDFRGYATRNDILCTDGRIIRRDAFQHNDGKRVPLVWNHNHSDIENVLGYGILHNVSDGVEVEGYLNDTTKGIAARQILEHGDVTGLSIFANHLSQNGVNVVHGDIKEVSLVLAGANSGAIIEEVLTHGDGEDEEVLTAFCNEGVTWLAHSDKDDDEDEEDVEEDEEDVEDDDEEEDVEEEKLEKKQLAHADEDAGNEDETVEDVFNSLSEKQKKIVYFMLAKAVEGNGDEVKHSDTEEDTMSRNVFETYGNQQEQRTVLSHSDMEQILKDAKRLGSLKESITQHLESGVLAHSITNADGSTQSYGIADIDYLFPDYKSLMEKPEFIQRKQEWVSVVMNGVHHTPFSRVKSMFADITMDEARAKGYIKGNLKKEEVFSLLKRTTDAKTVYKKQKLDKDDITDITDFDVVAWIKAEMRLLLEEEIARAILVGDGRLSSDDDHISEEHIRPIAKEHELFSVKIRVAMPGSDVSAETKNFMNQVIRSRKLYRGSGNPTMFTSEDLVTEMLLLEDGIGHKLYKTEAELATALRVSRIVTCPFFDELYASETAVDGDPVLAIIVNMGDYNVGTNNGGQTSFFDDFDIDYNQFKYLYETRISGALVKPFSALVFLKGNVSKNANNIYPDKGAVAANFSSADMTRNP